MKKVKQIESMKKPVPKSLNERMIKCSTIS